MPSMLDSPPAAGIGARAPEAAGGGGMDRPGGGIGAAAEDEGDETPPAEGKAARSL